jgi:hypothetical protein
VDANKFQRFEIILDSGAYISLPTKTNGCKMTVKLFSTNHQEKQTPLGKSLAH